MEELILRKAEKAASEILSISRNSIFLEMRFLEAAVCRMTPLPGGVSLGCDGKNIFYDPIWLIRLFQKDPDTVTVNYLHTVMHALFCHPFVNMDVDRLLWGLSCDIAAEMQIQLLELRSIKPQLSQEAEDIIHSLSKDKHIFTAEKIFMHFRSQNLTENELLHLSSLFARDDHSFWYANKEEKQGMYVSGGHDAGGDRNSDNDDGDTSYCKKDDPNRKGNAIPDISLLTNEQAKLREVWQETARSTRTEIEHFIRSKGDTPGSLIQALDAVTRERYDYADFLRKFSVYGEVMRLDNDSFDYSFYCYGLREYGDVALIEPLEYKEEKRIRDFVIAVDTSGSVKGEIVQGFLRKTWNILSSGSSFFSRVNVHIIQCDSKIQKDTVITCSDDINKMFEDFELHGFGGTDFRPVFEYVDKLCKDGAFSALQGLLYFTDGWGNFPEKQPDYRTAFVFLENGGNNYEVPVWAIKLILPEEEFENTDNAAL